MRKDSTHQSCVQTKRRYYLAPRLMYLKTRPIPATVASKVKIATKLSETGEVTAETMSVISKAVSGVMIFFVGLIKCSSTFYLKILLPKDDQKTCARETE